MRVLVEAAEWASYAMGHSRWASPRVRLERRTSGGWHFDGAPYSNFNITNTPRLVLEEEYNRWMINWCHFGEGASLVARWQVSRVEGEEQGEEGEEEEEEEEGEDEEEEENGQEEHEVEEEQSLEEEEEEDEDGEEENEDQWEWEEFEKRAHCLSLHLQRDSLHMKYWGDCGTTSFPGVSTGTARYERVPGERGTGRRETVDTAAVEEPLQLQPLKDGQVQILAM